MVTGSPPTGSWSARRTDCPVRNCVRTTATSARALSSTGPNATGPSWGATVMAADPSTTCRFVIVVPSLHATPEPEWSALLPKPTTRTVVAVIRRWASSALIGSIGPGSTSGAPTGPGTSSTSASTNNEENRTAPNLIVRNAFRRNRPSARRRVELAEPLSEPVDQPAELGDRGPVAGETDSRAAVVGERGDHRRRPGTRRVRERLEQSRTQQVAGRRERLERDRDARVVAPHRGAEVGLGRVRRAHDLVAEVGPQIDGRARPTTDGDERTSGPSQRGPRHARHLRGPGGALREGVHEERGIVRHPARGPLGRVERLRARLVVADRLERAGRAPIMGQREMRLLQHRHAVALHPVDEPKLPQRTPPIERKGLEPGHERVQLLLATGPGQRGEPHVIRQVEAVVVDPHRPSLAEGDGLHPAAQRGPAMEAPRDVAARVVEPEAAALVEEGRRLEQGQRADVLGRASRLAAQRRCGPRAEALVPHAALPPSNPWCVPTPC